MTMKTYRKKQSAHRRSLFGASLPLRRALNLAILAVLYPAFSYANPDGAQIVSGQVSIDTATPGVTTVTNSPNAIINWQNFSIAQNELTRFIQQNGQSAVLNRIIGQNPSEILGQLTSNGKVFLINPNGIVFGAGSTVDTQGLIASSLNLSDQDFLSGNYHFMAGSSAGNILNEGIIRAGKDGNIILIAPQIENNGIIKSEGGSITLAAGQELTITNLDTPDIRFQIQAPADSVLNLGKLLTEGGAINVFASTIKHSGEINADSVEMDAQGNIRLVAQQDITLESDSKISANNSQGDAGTIHIDSKTGTTLTQGAIEAQAGHSASLMTGKGGHIELLGEQVGVLDQARIDAGGENGGGQVLIGGDYQGKNPDIHNAKATYIGKDTTIKADAKTDGDGGKVIAWSDQSTRAYGDISAKGGSRSGNGGFIETSGHWLDTAGIKINASSPNGQSGNWLLDPHNITINAIGPTTAGPTFPSWTADADSSVILNTDINSQLNSGTNVTIYTGGVAGTDAGNITLAGSISKTSGGDATLHLKADNSIFISSSIGISSTSNKLNVTLNADADANSVGNIEMGAGSSITTNGGNIVMGGGADPMANDAYGTATSPHGVSLQNASLNAGAGLIRLRGYGYGSASNSDGVHIDGGTISATGNIDIWGWGGSFQNNSRGLYILNSALIGSSGGAIYLKGDSQGATGSFKDGVLITSGSQVTNTGAGTITINGGGRGDDHAPGVAIADNSTLIQTVNGSLSITGQTYSGGTGNYGVAAWSATPMIQATGTGNMSIIGIGGPGGSLSHGITLDATSVQTNSGALSLTGTGGDGTNDNHGVVLNSNTSLTTTGGTLSITGIGQGAAGTGNLGIYITLATLSTTNAGAITLDGRGAGTALGLYLGSGTVVGGAAGQTGDITLIADTGTGLDSIVMSGATAPKIQGTGALTLKPLNNATTIGLANSGAFPFNLSSTELSYIQNGFSNITIGNSTGTGLIDLGASGWTAPSLSNLALQNAGALSNGITLNGALTLGAGKNLTLNTTGLITNNAPISAGNVSLKAGKMALAGGTISGSSAVSLLSANAIDIGTGATDLLSTLELSNAELNTITTLILRIGDSSSGAIDIKSALGNALSTDALKNISTALNLTSGGAITQQSGATIAALSGLSLSGTLVTLSEANPEGVIAGSATSGDFKYRSSSLVTVSTVDGQSGLNVTGGNILLESDHASGINQSSPISTTGVLALKTIGPVNLPNTANSISALAADLSLGASGTGSFFVYSASSTNVGGAFSGISGISTNNQDIGIATGAALTVSSPIAAGTAKVALEADALALTTGTVTASDVNLRPHTATRAITIGSATCNAGPCLTLTDLYKIHAPTVGIGTNNVANTPGAIYVAGITSGTSLITDIDTGTTRIGLLSGAGITQGGTITVQDLGIDANGTVILSAANNITNLAAKTMGQNFTFSNGSGFSVKQMSGSTASYSYSINGIDTNNGNVSLTTTSGDLNIPGQINAGTGSVNLTATAGSVYGSGISPDIIAGTLSISALNNIHGSGGLHTNVPLLSQLSATTGFIDVRSFNTTALELQNTSAATTIDISAYSPITVASAGISSTSNNDINLTASNVNSTGYSLTVNAPITTTGSISLMGSSVTGTQLNTAVETSTTSTFANSTPFTFTKILSSTEQAVSDANAQAAASAAAAEAAAKAAAEAAAAEAAAAEAAATEAAAAEAAAAEAAATEAAATEAAAAEAAAAEAAATETAATETAAAEAIAAAAVPDLLDGGESTPVEIILENSLEQVTAVVVATTTQSGSSVDTALGGNSDSAKTTGGSADATADKDKKTNKQCTK